VAHQDPSQEIVLAGIAASPGIAHGPAFVYLQKELDVPCYHIDEGEVEGEVERFEQAILTTRQQITEIRNKIAASLGEGEASIFDAHLMVLEDSALIGEVTDETRKQRTNIECCYDRVVQRYIAFFSSMEDEYLRERVSDIRDVSKRLLHNLLGHRRVDLSELSTDRVVVSEDLSPSDTADMRRDKLLGIVTDGGGRTSHSVIMARSLRIPAVVGLHDATRQIASGDEILIDGYDGTVVVNPTEDRLFQYGKRASEREKLDALFASVIDEASETADGRPLQLLANIEGVQDMDLVNQNGADGVGLFRTEAIFLRHHGFPPEDTQYEAYAAVAEAAKGKPVTIRTLDLGGDKTFEGYGVSREDNPFMGFRAIRFCLERTGVFKTQLRAILRASAVGKVRLMYPMVSGVGEMRQANAILESVRQEMREAGEPFDEGMEVGAMIELPSAAAIVDLLAEHCDFFSIGSNDLIQYLMAVDRLNDKVAHLYEPTHPAVVRTLRQIAEQAHRAGVPVGICGEIAGDPVLVSLLIGLGIDALSMTPAMLPEIKYFVRRARFDAIQKACHDALAMNESIDILETMKHFHLRTLGNLLEDYPELSREAT